MTNLVRYKEQMGYVRLWDSVILTQEFGCPRDFVRRTEFVKKMSKTEACVKLARLIRVSFIHSTSGRGSHGGPEGSSDNEDRKVWGISLQ